MTNTKSIEWPPELIALDLETTGLEPARCGILEIGACHLFTGAARAWLVDPGTVAYEAEALRVNGLTPAALRAPRHTPGAALTELMEWVRALDIPGDGRALLVGRNPGFEWAFLAAAAGRELMSWDLSFFVNTFHRRKLDTHSAAMALAMARGWPVAGGKIDDLYRLLEVAPEERPHTAAGGAAHVVAGLEAIMRELQRGAGGKEGGRR